MRLAAGIFTALATASARVLVIAALAARATVAALRVIEDEP